MTTVDTGRKLTAWGRALHRAECRNTRATQLQRDGDVQYWTASSFSNPSSRHGVVITADASGVRAECSCEGGQSGKTCAHKAICLRAAGLLPDCCLYEPDPAPAAPVKPVRKLPDPEIGKALLMGADPRKLGVA